MAVFIIVKFYENSRDILKNENKRIELLSLRIPFSVIKSIVNEMPQFKTDMLLYE